MLLEIACIIDERGDIELREEERGQWRRAEDKAASVYVFPSIHDTKPSRKRTCTREGSLSRAPKKLKTTHALQGIERSKPVKANQPARQVHPPPAKPPRKQGKKAPSVKKVQNDGIYVQVGPMTRSKTKTKISSRGRKQTSPRF